MDLNDVALWLAALFTLSLFTRSVRARGRQLGWVIVSGAIGVASAAAWLWFRDTAGYIGGVLVLALILTPTWAHNAASRALRQFSYRRARWLASLAATLHPLDGWPALPRLFHAFQLAHEGKTTEADALLLVVAGGEGSAASIARAQRLQILGRWRELKESVENAGLPAGAQEPSVLALYLRALGELGEVEELAEFMRANEPALLAAGVLEPALLYLFAFTGQVTLTERTLDSALLPHSDDTRAAWLALATKSAGDADRARVMYSKLRSSADAQISERARHFYNRLSVAPADDPPTPRTQSIVMYFAQGFVMRQSLTLNARGQRGERGVTVFLIATNTAIYALGSYPFFAATRDSFGALWAFNAAAIFSGERWRLVSYLFVHANALHLLMNMGGLWVLGPFVERAYGRLRFSLIYLCSGLAGSALYLLLGKLNLRQDDLVGASGCIMGLLGATGAVMLRAWFTQRTPMAGQMFLRLLLAVAFQVAFDYNTPQVAGLAHAAGLVGGFLAGLLLREGVSPARSVSALS